MSGAKKARPVRTSENPAKPGRHFPGVIQWWGPLFTPTGYGDEARGFFKSLRVAGFPLRAVPFDTVVAFAEKVAAEDPLFFKDVVASMELEPTSPVVAVTHIGATARFVRFDGADLTIARTMWETDRLFERCAENLNNVDEVWVPSAFNKQVFEESGVTVPIEIVGAGVDCRRFRPGLPAMAITGARTLKFLSIFEWSYRKGWDVLLRAWASAFKPTDDVTLVLRIYPRNRFANNEKLQDDSELALSQGLEELGLRREDLAPIVVIGRHLDPVEMPRLMAAADCYVGPSRGEGWGRPFQEAMASGLPVIATRWSGNLEFMDDSNSLLLDIEGLVAVDARMDVPHYRGQKWAEPSVEHLRELLVRVASERELRRRTGRKARADMESSWQWQHITGRLGDHLFDLAGSHPAMTGSAALSPSSAIASRPATGEESISTTVVRPASTPSRTVESKESVAPTSVPISQFLLADAIEILADDTLLQSFAHEIRADAGITLLIYGPGLDPAVFEESLNAQASRSGVDLENGPGILAILPPEGGAASDATVVEKAAGYLTRGTPSRTLSALPIVRPGTIAEFVSGLFGVASTTSEKQRTGDQAKRASSSRRPLVSVLVPVFNRAGYLEESLSSVLAQTYGDLEILVVDDGSTDGAEEVGERFAREDRRVKSVRNPENLGLVGNHRRCLSLASGSFIKFVHTDDRLRPTAIARLVDAIGQSPNIAMATGARDVIDADGVLLPPINSTTRVSETDACYDGILFGDTVLSQGINLVGEPTSVLFPRLSLSPEDFSRFAGRSYTSLLDVSTWLTLLAGGQIAYVAEPLSEVRIHAGQEGQALGAVIEHLEWLHAIGDAHSMGFLRQSQARIDALGTIAGRLVTAALASPTDRSDEVIAAVRRTFASVAELRAPAGIDGALLDAFSMA